MGETTIFYSFFLFFRTILLLSKKAKTICVFQAALVGMPTFSFDVTMYGGDVSIVPGLEAWLTQFMKETVFR